MCRCDEPVPPITFMIVVALGGPPPMSNIIAAIVRVGLVGALMSALCDDQSVGLSARAQAFPHQLSQGEAQRASLARALVKSPALLLADEPTGNLDEDMAAEILDLMKEIWTRGTTILLATHQVRVATQLKRRTLCLDAGRLVKDEG